MLVELGVAEQRYRAVLEVLDDGASVTDVARRYGVARQTVHGWLRRYANQGGLAGLVDRSSRPQACPHQMSAAAEARVIGLRRAHPAWGPSRIVWQLERDGIDPVPGRSSVYRALLRHGLVEAKKRKRRREDYRRWERGRAMELWQMDVMGRVFLAGGLEVKVVTGIDDHSRFVVCARVVLRATARPVCQALAGALAAHGVPGQILTDNGKVFTARFGTGPGPVMFDRICADNGIKHLLTAPYSPTTTGKVERLHKTMRLEFFTPSDRKFAAIPELQAALAVVRCMVAGAGPAWREAASCLDLETVRRFATAPTPDRLIPSARLSRLSLLGPHQACTGVGTPVAVAPAGFTRNCGSAATGAACAPCAGSPPGSATAPRARTTTGARGQEGHPLSATAGSGGYLLVTAKTW